MTKSATDVMNEVVVAAVLDGVAALKAAAKGVPNALVREVNAIHANTTVADLPPELQAAISESVRGAFGRLRAAGYTVAPIDAPPAPPRRPSPSSTPRPERPRRPPTGGRPGPRPPRRG